MRLSHGVVSYGKGMMEFSFCHVDRKTLEIAVYPDQTVMVKAPSGVKLSEINRRVAKRARWIIKQQNFFRQFAPRTLGRSYVGGETHLYLGRHYRLKIRSGRSNETNLTKGYFEIRVKGLVSSDKIKSMMDGWYEKKAAVKFRESLDCGLSCFKKPTLPRPRLQIKRLKKRWGSLSAKGMLTLNTDLIRAPRECIDYVVAHELCHLRCKDHSPNFYRLLGKIMPDWQDRKHKLELTLA